MAPYLHMARRAVERPSPSQEGQSVTATVELFLAPFPTSTNASVRSAHCPFPVPSLTNLIDIYISTSLKNGNLNSSDCLYQNVLHCIASNCIVYLNLFVWDSPGFLSSVCILLNRTAAWFIQHTSLTWRYTTRWDMTFWIPNIKHLDWRTCR